MSMSQLPSPDEEYDNIWAQAKWYHILLFVLFGLIVIPVFYAFLGITDVKDKICKPKPSR